MLRSSRLLLAVLPLVMLGGCIKLGSKPPAHLLTLSATGQPTEAASVDQATARTIELAVPDVPRKLATQRVPVQATDTAIAYVKDAQWVDMPRNLFRTLLSDSLTATGQFVAERSQHAPGVAARLSGDLLDFGIDARSKKAVVTYEATLSFIGEPRVLRRRFSAEVPARKINAKRVAAPISEAAHKVAADVAAWVKEN